MRLAVLGAGAIGPASAILAVSRGHEAVVWSPSGAGTRGIRGHLDSEGVVEGRFPVAVAATLLDAFDGADAALLAVPAYAFATVLPAIAQALPARLPLLISPAASLAPLVLDALLAARGAVPDRAPIGAMGTTPCGARRLAPDRVRIAMVRGALDMAAVPARAAPETAALAQALFGNDYPLSAEAFHVSLVNGNPIVHAALALANVTRMEQAEDWSQYAAMTPAVCRLMEALDAERAALAAAFGTRTNSLRTHFHRANGVPMAPLPEMTAQIAAGSANVLGPKTLETRYVTEDVPFGLAYYLRVGAARGVAMPVTEAVVTTLEAMWGRGLRDNPMLEAIDLSRLPALLRDGVGRG
jgi:opine dehydrogenase